jgi:hypothetical protein
MASQLADYEIAGPAMDDRVLPCLRARRPARLGAGEATVWLLGPAGRGSWEAARARLEAVAAVRSDQLPSWLEAGTAEWAQRPVVWVSAATLVAGTLASPPGDLSVADKLRAVAAASRGAHALHEHGQLHGAICPQTVALVAADGVLTSTFGSPPAPGAPQQRVWKGVLGPPSLADGKQPVAHVGFPPLGFVDPQLLRGDGGRWSDIWGLGATLQQALVGSPPFPGTEELPVVQGLAKVLAAPAPAKADLPERVAGLVQACLSLDPIDRPATARDFADQLDDVASRW